MDGVRLRAATGADAGAVGEIWYEGWRDGHLGHVPQELTRVRTRASFLDRAARRVGDTVVAEAVDEVAGGEVAGGEVAGFVMVVGDEVEQGGRSTTRRRVPTGRSRSRPTATSRT